jgi:hypothetical protein
MSRPETFETFHYNDGVPGQEVAFVNAIWTSPVELPALNARKYQLSHIEIAHQLKFQRRHSSTIIGRNFNKVSVMYKTLYVR